jgi:bifunctional DNA-binding transcriptional regulator/antitoxin component of YhaV-PrlF toxin-antitoxin module
MSDSLATTVDAQGGVTLPPETWRLIGVQPGGAVVVEVTEEGLLLRAKPEHDVETYTDERVREFLEEDRATPEELERWRRAAHK